MGLRDSYTATMKRKITPVMSMRLSDSRLRSGSQPQNQTVRGIDSRLSLCSSAAATTRLSLGGKRMAVALPVSTGRIMSERWDSFAQGSWPLLRAGETGQSCEKVARRARGYSGPLSPQPTPNQRRRLCNRARFQIGPVRSHGRALGRRQVYGLLFCS